MGLTEDMGKTVREAACPHPAPHAHTPPLHAHPSTPQFTPAKFIPHPALTASAKPVRSAGLQEFFPWPL